MREQCVNNGIRIKIIMCLLSENKKLDLGGICYLSYIALRPYVKGSIQILRHQDPLQYNDVILERG